MNLKEQNEKNVDFLNLQYQILSNKQLSHDSLVWNTPSLLLVAQSFLWELALNNGVTLIIRLGISFVSVLIGVASLQTFLRNRLMEIADSEQLYSIEKFVAEKGKYEVMAIHNKLEKRNIILNGNYYNLKSRLNGCDLCKKKIGSRVSAFSIWKIIFYIIIIIACMILFQNFMLAVEAYEIDEVVNSVLTGIMKEG